MIPERYIEIVELVAEILMVLGGFLIMGGIINWFMYK